MFHMADIVMKIEKVGHVHVCIYICVYVYIHMHDEELTNLPDFKAGIEYLEKA